MKNHSKLVKGVLFAVVTLSLLGMLLVPSFQQQTTANNENGRAEYLARLNKGLRAVEFARSSKDVELAVANMDEYITERSGLRLSPIVSDKLSLLEQSALSNNKGLGLISFDKLVDTIANLGLERVSELSDVELDQVITSTQGFKSSDMPEKARLNPLIALRPGNYVQMDKREAIEELKALQSSKTQLIAKGYIQDFIAQELRTSLVNLATASPEKFGQNWDLINNRPAKGLTPSQVYLLSYSLASGDLLTDDKAELDKRMDGVYRLQARAYGSYPNPRAYLAYGDNGYLYAAPVSIFFNEKVQIDLLDRLTSK